MDAEPVMIESGIHVNIKRTDGRVHSALVSGVNIPQRTVTVEWFERGETKGKEVEIDAILALNPELRVPPSGDVTLRAPPGPPGEMPPPAGTAVAANRIVRTSSRQSIPVANKANIGQRATHRARATNVMAPPVNATIATNGNHQNHQPIGAENIPPPQQAGMVTRQQMPTRSQTSSNVPQQIANMAVGGGRRSNVVKEVEKLKENREKRRQRQAELKEEKEALMNLDPGNPNWEFSAMIRDYQTSIEFKPLRDTDPVSDHQITVCVRKRPLNRKECTRREIDVISVPSKDRMIVHEPKSKVDLTKFLENQHFRFDYAFDESCDNDVVYKYTAKPLVKTIFEGGMATCFAYGQTGSGKTHTMGGDFNGKIQDCKKGIYAMAAKDVFKLLRSPKYRPLNLLVSASFFEIYSGKVFDLLNDKAKLRVLEDGKQQVQIVGLTEKIVDSCDEVLKLIQHGNTARTSGQTSANSNSSRSHAVFQIIVRSPGLNRIHGKFSLIDLAGNERGADTSSANRQTRMEGAEINKSLLALKECIRALGKRGAHLPFRASKLTQVLRDSFIGEKSKTCMIAMISPGMSSCEHSLNTLRYADRVKELAANDPTVLLRPEPMLTEEQDEPQPDLDNEELVDHEMGEDGERDDLAQLRSLNEGDMSADMYTFHEAISQVQQVEEEVLDDHKSLNEYLDNIRQRSQELYRLTLDVDYDQDGKTNLTYQPGTRRLAQFRSNSSINNNNSIACSGLTIKINEKCLKGICVESDLETFGSGFKINSGSFQNDISDIVESGIVKNDLRRLVVDKKPWLSISSDEINNSNESFPKNYDFNGPQCVEFPSNEPGSDCSVSTQWYEGRDVLGEKPAVNNFSFEAFEPSELRRHSSLCSVTESRVSIYKSDKVKVVMEKSVSFTVLNRDVSKTESSEEMLGRVHSAEAASTSTSLSNVSIRNSGRIKKIKTEINTRTRGVIKTIKANKARKTWIKPSPGAAIIIKRHQPDGDKSETDSDDSSCIVATPVKSRESRLRDDFNFLVKSAIESKRRASFNKSGNYHDFINKENKFVSTPIINAVPKENCKPKSKSFNRRSLPAIVCHHLAVNKSKVRRTRSKSLTCLEQVQNESHFRRSATFSTTSSCRRRISELMNCSDPMPDTNWIFDDKTPHWCKKYEGYMNFSLESSSRSITMCTSFYNSQRLFYGGNTLKNVFVFAILPLFYFVMFAIHTLEQL